MSMSKVSAVIIAFNEEADIARALRSIQWCDEVLVVDSGSSDRTAEICAAHGCRVLRHEFSGYGAQKAFAVRQAVNDWVFVVDADEEVSPELSDEILTKLEDAGDCRGFYVPITTVLWDHVVRDRTRHTKPKLRLFDRRFGNFQNELVHESVLLEGRTEQLQHRMYNYSYVDIADYFEKFNRYTSAAARECYLHGKRPSFVGAVARLPLTFFQLYFLRGFFQDGAVGLVWSLFSSLYPTVKFLKVLELRRVYANADQQLVKIRATAASRAKKPEFARHNWTTVYAAHPGTALTPVWLAGAQGIRRRAETQGFAYGLAVTAVALALLLMVLLGGDDPAKYSMVLLAAVGATVCFWGARPGLAATVLALAGLDYFAIPPRWSFSVPNTDGLMQLVVFSAMSMLIGVLIHKAKQRSFR
jgi:glycosyltransferase involved in cell wall biosynthesis